MRSPLGDFTKFTIGFLIFISLSLGITVWVNQITVQQEQDAHTAAALQAMLVPQK